MKKYITALLFFALSNNSYSQLARNTITVIDSLRLGNVWYKSLVPGTRTITINGETKDLSVNQTWTITAASPVTSVYGRTGAITASSGDYAAYYASLVHNHSATDITSGQLAQQRLPNGFTLQGTAGTGLIGLPTQSSNPSAPSSGVNIFASSSGQFALQNTSGSISRWLLSSGTNTYTLPSLSGGSGTLVANTATNNFSQSNNFNGATSFNNLVTVQSPSTSPALKIQDGTTLYYQTIYNQNPGFVITNPSENLFTEVELQFPSPFHAPRSPNPMYIYNFPEESGTMATQSWVSSQGYMTGSSMTLRQAYDNGHALPAFILNDDDGKEYLHLSSPQNDNQYWIASFDNQNGGMRKRFYLPDFTRSIFGGDPDNVDNNEAYFETKNNPSVASSNGVAYVHGPNGVIIDRINYDNNLGYSLALIDENDKLSSVSLSPVLYRTEYVTDDDITAKPGHIYYINLTTLSASRNVDFSLLNNNGYKCQLKIIGENETYSIGTFDSLLDFDSAPVSTFTAGHIYTIEFVSGQLFVSSESAMEY